MNSTPEMVEENEKPDPADQDLTPNVPLRQRRLPASFWQEPSSPVNRETLPSTAVPTTIHQFASVSPQSWTMNSSSMLPMVLPQRLVAQNNFLLSQTASPPWMRSCCTCSSCLNYPQVMPRLPPEVYGGVRYRLPASVPYCPGINCVDQSCKLCYTAPEHWHPDRLRHLRLRAARYNAILD